MATGKKLIGIGDKTTTGGVVLSAHLDVQINNQGTATENCLASCGQCGQNGMIKVVEKVAYIINELQAAREGDLVMCACPEGANRLIGSPGSTIVGGTEHRATVYQPFGNEAAMHETYATLNEGLNSGTIDVGELLKSAAWPPYNPMTGEDLTDKLRAALEANHKKAIILTLADAAATLKDMAGELAAELKDKAVELKGKAEDFSWEKDGTKTLNAANTANDIGGYGAAIYKAYDLAKQFGDYGVKAEVFTSKGKEYIAITTKNNSDKVLRHVLINGVRVKLNGHKYRTNNYKVMQLGLTPQSRMSGYKGAAVATFVISATINTNELVFNDDYHLVDWFGNVGTDMFKGMVAIGAGEAALLALGLTGGAAIIGGVLAVVAASVIIELVFEEWKVSEKVVSGLNNAIN